MITHNTQTSTPNHPKYYYRPTPSEKIIKTFKQTLLSLRIDRLRDQEEGGKTLLRYIAEAPSIDEIPAEYDLMLPL